MRRLYFFDKQFNYKDVIVINNFNPIVDIVSTQSFKIETPLMPVVDNGDICILKDNNEVVFIGNILNVEESEKKTKTITISYIDELFNINGEVEDLSGNIITWITNTLTTNFISVSDNLQKISLSIVNNCATAYSGTYTFESTNIKDCLRNIFNYSGVYVDFEIDFAVNGSIDSLVCNIRSNIEENTIKLKYNMPIISEIKRTVTNSQNINKLVVLPDSSVTGGSRYEFYLLKDGTISTDASNINRFENVKQDIKYYASDFTAESLLNTAKEVLGGEQFNHSIGFYIKHNSTFNISLYKKILFYDKDNIVYNSIITKIQYGTEFDYVELGVVRLKLTDKLQKKDTKTATSSSSSGGGSYVLPQATASTLGGIIAETKTTETNEVKIDTATGKLYASGVGAVNMDNVIDGETYVKTENNLTDTLKSNYDTAYTNTHTHSNKTILDNTTASYTTDEQTKLSGIAIGAEVNVQSDWNAISGDALILNKPTTISGYGITDAYTKTEVDSKLTAVYKYKGSVANFASLPTSGLTIGDVYNVEDTGDNYAWTGTVWDKLAGTIDLSGYVPTIRTVNGHALSSDVTVSKSDVGLGNVDNTSDANKPVSSAQATAIGLKVDKTSIKNEFDSSATAVYSSKYVEDNFAQMLFTTTYYANKTETTTADLTSTIPTLNSANYLSSTTTNTAFNWNTPNYIFTNTLTGGLSLQASSLIYLSLPFSISLASQTVNFGYRVKINGVAVSSNQTFGAVAYTGGSGHTDINRVYLQCTTDLLTSKTNYVAGDIVTIEVFTQQATSTSMVMRVYCGCTIDSVDYYTYNELAQFRSQLSNATPVISGTVYGRTSDTNTNTSIGYNSFSGNVGYHNTTIGNLAGHNASGNGNTLIGYYSGYRSGNYTTFIGNYAGAINTADDNTAVGNQAMMNNTGGSSNTVVGSNALQVNQNGSNNAILGNKILPTSVVSSKNSIVGSLALGNASICNDNAVLGYNALYYGGNYNVSIGSLSGRYISDGSSSNYASSNNIYIGYKVMPNASGETNQIIIGYQSIGHGSNTATIGNSSITDNYLTGNIRATGDILIPTGKTLKINNVDVLALKAPLASPALTGTPTAPTATAGTNTTQIATTAFVKALGDTKAKVDASNLTSGNVTSWQTKLETKLYLHTINDGIGLAVNIINKSSSPFTTATLASFLYNRGNISTTTVYSCSGLRSNVQLWMSVVGIYSSNGTTLTRFSSTGGNTISETVSSINDIVSEIT